LTNTLGLQVVSSSRNLFIFLSVTIFKLFWYYTRRA